MLHFAGCNHRPYWPAAQKHSHVHPALWASAVVLQRLLQAVGVEDAAGHGRRGGRNSENCAGACTCGGSGDIPTAESLLPFYLLAAFSQRTPLVRGRVGGQADDALHARHGCRLSLPMRRRQQQGGSDGGSCGPPRRCGKQLTSTCCRCRTAGTAGAALQSAAQTVPQAEAARRSWATPDTNTAVLVITGC